MKERLEQHVRRSPSSCVCTDFTHTITLHRLRLALLRTFITHMTCRIGSLSAHLHCHGSHFSTSGEARIKRHIRCHSPWVCTESRTHTVMLHTRILSCNIPDIHHTPDVLDWVILGASPSSWFLFLTIWRSTRRAIRTKKSIPCVGTATPAHRIGSFWTLSFVTVLSYSIF